MKYFINKFKATFAFLSLVLLSTSSVFAQATETTSTDTTGTGFNIPLNYVLLAVALVLAFLILILVNTTKNAIDLFKSNNPDSMNKKILSFLAVAMLSIPLLQAQDAATSTAQTLDLSKAFTFILILLILIEVGFILYLVKSIEFLSGIKAVKESSKEQSLWEKINSFQDLSEEDNLDVGHEYDGIRELDNITPPWFAFGFVASMIIGVIYIYQFNVSHRIPSQYVELENAELKAKTEQDAFMANSTSAVDEKNVKMLDDAGIAKGAAIFKTNCQICHGANGEGISGPNLTDDYWLHGGSLNDIFHTIKYGVLEKGMTPWESMLSPAEINEVASYVKSLKGTNPANAKEKQGELYQEAGDASASTATTDSTTVEG
ncbi:MAG: c-type cytochrome [Chitinophagales bacterium]|nr:c-type cytochrome [Chitinophagales bacterium]